MFLADGIIIVALFFVSMFMPLLGWTLPYYKVKKVAKRGKKERLIINILAIVIIARIKIDAVVFYLAIFGILELSYYFFENKYKKIEIYDRIFITALIISGILITFGYLNKEEILKGIEVVRNFYMKFGKAEIAVLFEGLKNTLIYRTFLHISTIIFLTYYFIKNESFRRWKISYLWLVPYIIIFFINEFILKDNMFLENGLEIIKLMFRLYFVKIFVNTFANKRIKDSIQFLLGIVLTMMLPEITFIIGGLLSGVTIQVIRVKND